MAQRQSNGIGRIIRSRRGRQRAYTLDHIHYLLLLRSSIAHNGLFDLQRSIFENIDAGLSACEKYDSPAVRHGNAGSYIRIEKKLLD